MVINILRTSGSGRLNCYVMAYIRYIQHKHVNHVFIKFEHVGIYHAVI